MKLGDFGGFTDEYLTELESGQAQRRICRGPEPNSETEGQQ
jgi:hypothetical protein